jgi:hypothetical protein
MPGRRDEITKRWCFYSVQEFWDSKVLGIFPASVQQGSFVGQVLKGTVDNGRLRELRKEDVESGIRPDTLIVSQVLNLERNWNWDRLQNPPPRTGMFSSFMDEVEEVAALAGCRHVWVEKVANEFLPEKLEARGYRRLNDPNGFPNPDYVKILS